MPRIICADLTGTCDESVEGATGRDVLLGYIAHANRCHRDHDISLDAAIAFALKATSRPTRQAVRQRRCVGD